MSMCDFISGIVSGMANVIVGHPFDTVKVNEQTLNSGTFGAINRIYELHGFRGFFRGMFFPLITSGFQNAIFFSTYEFTTQRLNVDEPRHQIKLAKELTILAQKKESEQKKFNYYGNCFLAGMCAGGIQSIFVGPVEMIKTNLQATKHMVERRSQLTSTYSVIRYLFNANGLRSFYQGYSSLILRDVPSGGVYMASYSLLTNLKLFNTRGRGHEESMTFLEHFFAGGMAGTLAWWVSIPPDVLKSKLETDDPNKRIWTGLVPCAKEIYRQNGLRGFFVGFWTISIRAFPVNGAVFVSYEFARKFCNKFNI